jgi:hypothetical protein
MGLGCQTLPLPFRGGIERLFRELVSLEFVSLEFVPAERTEFDAERPQPDPSPPLHGFQTSLHGEPLGDSVCVI